MAKPRGGTEYCEVSACESVCVSVCVCVCVVVVASSLHAIDARDVTFLYIINVKKTAVL